jgi:amino acid transporter
LRVSRTLIRVRPIPDLGAGVQAARMSIVSVATPPKHTRARLVGRPLAREEIDGTRLRKLVALPIFSSDALSSVAYATEAALGVLLLASASRPLLPIAAAVAALMVIVVASYRQTVRAYPSNGGAYAVAMDNLGVVPALVAGASILIDYLLTVAVSVSAASLALVSAFPTLGPYRVGFAVGFVAVLTLANIRGLRESGVAFAALTYLFVVSLALTFLVAGVRFALGQHPHASVPHALPAGTAALGLFLLLRAFASGASALTGVEAIANSTAAFETPQSRNAAATLGWLGGIAASLFLGVSLLALWVHAAPSSTVSVLSEIAHAIWGHGLTGQVGFLTVQASTLFVLCLAANASFQGFPRLTALMARDRYMPRQFENVGDRLVYSNGVLVLSGLSTALILIYDARVNSLIHLYVVGVFCAFTLSQTGMVRHWLRLRGTRWRRSVAINAVGAAATGVVAAVVVITKFAEGAWMVVAAVPVLVLTFRGIRRHYRKLRRRLDCAATSEIAPPIENRVLVVVDAELDGTARHALAFADAIRAAEPARAVTVDSGAETPAVLPTGAGGWIPLERLQSPEGRIDAIREAVWSLPHGGDQFVTVVISEQFDRPFLLDALRRPAFRLKLRLLQESGVAVCDVSSLSANAGEPVPRRIGVRVLVSDSRAASLRAAAYAASLGFSDTAALHFATDPDRAEALRVSWAGRQTSLPLEIVDAPYRDVAEAVSAYANDFVASPDQGLLYVVPEIVVTGWRRLLHNFRELYIKRSVLFDSPRIMLAAVPYHLRG